MTIRLFTVLVILTIISSCEEVIDLDLNDSDPEFIVEAIIYKDSVCNIRLTQTTSYFVQQQPEVVEDASITISDGTVSEELNYYGNGYYRGNSVTGTEGNTYTLEIRHNGLTYESISFMPEKTEIVSVSYDKGSSPGILNPYGETVFSIRNRFLDNPDKDNYYMIKYIENNRMLEKNYFMLTDHDAVGGVFNIKNDTISFSESIFYEGGEVEVQLFSIDKSVYDYFKQLNDVLFWKRRIIPPGQYNPVSNITNGALGYFAALSFDSEIIILE